MNDGFYTNVQVRGNQILYRGLNSNGDRVQEKQDFFPTLYLENPNSDEVWKTITGKKLVSVKPGDFNECREFVERYRNVEGMTVHGNTYWQYQFITSLYENNDDIPFNYEQIRILNIDIETESEEGFPNIHTANERINVISMVCGKHRHVFGLGDYKIDPALGFECHHYTDEKDLLQEFLAVWKTIDCDVITGWNVRMFDIPYIIRRVRRLFGKTAANCLSPWDVIKEETVEIRNKEVDTFIILGREILDYYELYRKYTMATQESYKLDHIAKVELGTGKVDWHDKYESFKEFYTKDFQLFVEYNIEDTLLIQKLENKLNMINLHISVAYLARVNYADVYGQTKVWDMLIYNDLHYKNVVIPLKKQSSDYGSAEQFAGAYVKEPIPGMYDWIVSFDLASLYPSLIRFCNISPDTLMEGVTFDCKVDRLLDKTFDTRQASNMNVCMAANGQCFRKDKHGFFPELMTHFFNQRKVSKKKMLSYKKEIEDPSVVGDKRKEAIRLASVYDIKQQAFKILLNSGYGAIGCSSFRHFDVRQAEAVTLTGQLAIRWIQNRLNDFLNKTLKTEKVDYTLASDTDSVFLNFGPLVKKVFANTTDKTKIINSLDGFCNDVIAPFIEKQYQELFVYLNGYEQTLDMKRDVIADKGLWTAKKRYALHVYDAEGVRYAKPKMKIMGIEVQRSSTPQICRKTLKRAIEIMLTETEAELIAYTKQVRDEFFKASVIDIASPRGINGMKKYEDANTVYKKGTPSQVKGALIYNNLLVKHNLTRKYESIVDGDKIKYVYLKVPNPTPDKILSFPGEIPKEFNIEKYVDRNTQYEKAFLDPLKSIANAIHWNTEEVNTLEGFFT